MRRTVLPHMLDLLRKSVPEKWRPSRFIRGAAVRWQSSLALQMYSMVAPVVFASAIIGIVASNGLATNASQLVEARVTKEMLIQSQGLMMTEADASKSLILYPDDSSIGGIKIRAHDANVELLLRLRSRVAEGSEIRRLLENLIRINDTELSPADMLIVEALAEDNVSRAREMHRRRYLPAQNQFNRLIAEACQLAEMQSAAARADMERNNSSSLRRIILALTFGIGFAVAGLIFIAREVILKPLRAVLDAISAVAGGDYSIAIPLQTTNEIGAVAAGVNQMVQAIRLSMRDMSVEAYQMSLQADVLTQVGRSLAQETEVVASRVSAISASGDGVAESIRNASVYLESIAASIDGLNSNANNAVRAASDAEDAARRTEESLQRLLQSSKVIDDVLDAISRITFESRLLGLNAAIEAAHVGSAGAGFGIVASQIRRLSERTREAALSISGQIESIRADIAETESGVGSISGVLRQVSTIARDVSFKVGEQNQATSDLNATVSLIVSASEDIASDLRKMAEAIELARADAGQTGESSATVAQSSRRLDHLLSRFRTGAHA